MTFNIPLPLSSGVPGIVLSRMKPSSIARNILLDRIPLKILSIVSEPVWIGSSCSSIHLGRTKEKKIEKPKTKRFLGELRSTNWRLERPTAVMIPNITEKMPPMIGSGMVTKRAPTLLTTPMQRRRTAAYWMTLLLPTLVTPIAPMFSL